MAKRKKKSNKSDRIPVIDFLLDIAQAAALDYFAYKRREKLGNKHKKIDPYEATGIAMGMGLIDDTEDLIRFGGMLGAMGAFDPDEPDDMYQSSYTGSHDSNPFYAPKDNKYAWRLNCEDGSEYDISPDDYETRDEYHEALHLEKYAWRDYCNDGSAFGIDPEDYETEEEYEDALEYAKSGNHNVTSGDIDLDETHSACIGKPDDGLEDMKATGTLLNKVIDQQTAIQSTLEDLYEEDDFHVFIYCQVETECGVDYYRTENTTIKKGDTVTVLVHDSAMPGKVISVERHMRFSVPKPVSETYPIIE